MAASAYVIILDGNIGNEKGDPVDVSFVLWADVPPGREQFYANPNAKSAWRDATAGDLDALRTGTVVEYFSSSQWPPNTPIEDIQTALLDTHTEFQAGVSGRNEWEFYGMHWDGTKWLDDGVKR